MLDVKLYLRDRSPDVVAAWREHFEGVRNVGVSEGDMLRVSSPRGSIEAPARVGKPREGVVFVPFHYAEANANQVTQSAFDPVSREPNYKQSAVRIERTVS